MPDPDGGLQRARLVDDDDPAGGLGYPAGGGLGRRRPGRPVAERPFRRRERRLGVDVADDAQQGVVRGVVLGMEREQIVTGDLLHRLRRAVGRHAVGVEPVEQSGQHDARQIRRIVQADLESREHLLPLALELGALERRIARALGDQVQAELEAVGHDQDVDEAQVRARPDVENAPDRIDAVGDLGGASAGRSLVEQRPGEGRHPVLAGGIVGRPGPDDQPQVDRRLLVVHHHDHLQPVVQGADLVGRERRLVPRQRGRRAFPGPVHRLLGERGRRDRRQAEDQAGGPRSGRRE